MYDICILGSGPAGLTAALYAAQGGHNVCLLTGSELGGKLSMIENITNFPGYSNISGIDLFNNMFNQIQEYSNINIIMDSATKIDGNKIYTEYSDIIESKVIINAIGLKPRTLGLTDEAKYIGNGISFCALCDGPFYKDKNVVVIGGGNTALSYAITLSNYCHEVEIIHRRNEFRASNDTINKFFNRLKDVSIRANLDSKLINITKNTITNTFELEIENTQTKETETLTNVHGIFYAIGYDKIEIPISNYINNIVYAGDCVEDIHQIITACSSGCKAAVKAMSMV
jgi:thioredoxin reductase (NADPH)